MCFNKKFRKQNGIKPVTSELCLLSMTMSCTVVNEKGKRRKECKERFHWSGESEGERETERERERNGREKERLRE